MAQHTKNEVKAGALIVAGFILLCIGIYIIADFKTFFAPKHTQYFSFDQVEGLKVEDDVTYAGIKCGKVQGISFERCAETAAVGDSVTRILVRVEIASNVPLTDKDKPRVSRGFTGNVYLDIVPWTRKTDNETLPQPLATTAKTPLRGYHYASLDEVAESAQAVLKEFQVELAKIGHVLANVDAATADAKHITSTVAELVDRNSPKIDEVVGNINKSSVSIEQMSSKLKTDLETVLADAKTTMSNAKDTVIKAREKIEEVLPKISSIVTKVDDSASNVKTASEDVKVVTAQVRDVVVGNRPNIDGTIEDLRQASARLNMAMEDIRRNPWKLLSRNIEADAYTQNIYDASMSFAEGARSLSMASAELHALATQPNPDPETVKKATERLNTLVAEMSKLESALYEAMKKPH